MAAARDQAARIVRSEPEMAEDAVARDASADVGEQSRADEAKRPAEAPPASAPEQPAASPAAAPAPKSGKRKFVMMGVVGLLALAAASYAAYYLMVGRFYVSTDDAYVRANNSMLGARVAGHIAAILPGDNALVRAGNVIFRIDDGDYRIAVDAARTRIATQQATIERIGRQVAAAVSSVEQAQAQLVSAQAGLKRADLDFDRQQALSTKGFASRATFEVSEAGRDQGAASVRSAQAAYDAAKDNVEVTKAQQAEARAQLAELQTQLAKAERDLEFTNVRAPVDGTFSNRLVNTGDYINVGQRLGNVVPLDGVYIDANYKETQLKRIRTGQRVTIKVDAYGFRKFTGLVDSISPAAGSVFTLLPPDNATGNFTKIVQRLPVRIRVPASVARQGLLRAGMSVYTTVDTREGAADADAETDLDAPMMIHPQ
ncbi:MULTISPECIES: HlyD family secretion protein [Bradyrhizobium]|jgi:membrane fusion protein, multidrug efflux system|uniref:HlyD family secretion protein n=1 Tax=Bradyrhizobium TaxID=374 RepID=UPI000486FDA2|nr:MULTISPECIES: HlyD family secretion protein [Bradyrhizobium]MCS3451714.1 membrane fusion protein (multidrug efflux system) [Bradyrhizobium elkanii]MCS3566187.1 membrane fusion protein (multidrug efflux system) [Bradyrhizobium elkanii]MCW2153083.1 membrane fusion protein (multidrug efflux system) [Bradyrhizobium elkanii]MCW2357178.1 membrane fusion protein (multidrug efflux system) [Bradyrhizobium elkanii]MCW2376816.1 membrane fusion protein (multidrug efflux system) [Bradyrhizobium elkanii]